MLIRPFEPARDRSPVVAFLAALERRTGVPPLGESKYVDLHGPGAGRGLVGEADGVAMYSHLFHHAATSQTELEVAAAPEAVDADVQAMVEAAAEAANATVLWWTFGDTRAATFAASRLTLHRELHKLSGPLPLAEPTPDLSDVEVAAFRPGVDDADWLEVNNAAFAGHPENGEWSQADLADRMGRDWFDPDGFRLSWVGGRLAGFCWTKRHDPEHGEIYVIAVHPDFQGRGLGRAIVLEGLEYLAGRGCTAALLYVDTVNESALRLYQSLGFEVERIDRCFVLPKGWPQEPQ